ncbi:MDR1 Multidrug resistance protein 1 [Candida maltosa Xu316]|uniref:Benomyl/methotrexate resistance protein n=1 Tax=Candida maltosa (strain Xu316) TaxID=1245528 RepID=M3HPT5_CANMX|nr:Benomyl/methotrexate resistance protein [Candida maltosa Xu316]
MYIFLRDSFIGRLTYHLSQHKFFSYPEEYPYYVVPKNYLSEISDRDSDKQIIVTWDGDNDPENPKNWPFYQKAFFIIQISFLTSSVYMGSAIYTPGIDELMTDLNIGRVVATLPLTLFVIGYGVGPMIFSPMSENAIFGRTAIYIITLTIFVILQIPTALVKNIAGLCILRFLGGFFASPCLATGGASVADVVSSKNIPIGISLWSLGAVCGPSLGPFFGSILAEKASWRWTFWFMCILSGFSLVMLSFTLPETFSKTLLRRKSQRLRAITGNPNITSEGEIENSKLTFNELVVDTLWRPIEVTIMEPVVLLIDIYVGLVYSILYLFFEVFPIYFVGVRGFTRIELGCTYFASISGVLLACSIYIPVIRHQISQQFKQYNKVYPEVFIPMAIVGGVAFASGYFIFGWSATRHTHWIGPLIGAAINSIGTFLIFQTLFNYMAVSFDHVYVASVFASNCLVRSVLASVFPLFANPLFNNLAIHEFPIGWGCSVLGFIACGMILIPVLFYLAGPKLRARSKYAH